MHSGSAPAERSGRSAHSAEDVHCDQESSLWERMLSKENLLAALGRVEVDRGAPGVDGVTTAELRPWLLVHWPVVRAELDAGTFQLADGSHLFRELDKWLHRRMRQIRWKEWKLPRTRRAMLRKLGINEQSSREWGNSSKGYWRIAGSPVLQRALPHSYWEGLGLRMLKPAWQRLRSAR
ncbi:group II intron maturase-specific domain-containing protein [Streptomyces sp. MUM 2J]|uniref:group II intron maturase-specific domain-containing protein n=1 Tax=Streptomyces sp. MUM 2J TaxID=2791987 RepID=UPI001F04EB47|nr:group II intron maturase-specific domain-containing protein [Streptomyces sp. MUM 2J]MCH0563241.1 hypothetical protein [Streptomyces sp. MUM 2J]